MKSTVSKASWIFSAVIAVHAAVISIDSVAFESGQVQQPWVRTNYEPLRQRIETLKTKGDQPLYRYQLAKAQCLLNTSLHEYERTDGTAYVKQSYGQAERLVQLLESNQVPPLDIAVVDSNQRIRNDLWETARGLKTSAGFACSREQLACFEVHMLHATHEYHQLGWRHANPYVSIAEDFLEAAKKSDATCTPAVAASSSAVSSNPTPQVIKREIDIRALGLFKFDRSELPDLLPEGRAQIDRFIAQLPEAFSLVQKITIVGHTDRLNRTKDPLYNDKLSARRAQTVQTYLQSKLGPTLNLALWTNAGRAATQPVTSCNDKDFKGKPRSVLIQCLEPDRRVTIEVTGIAK